MNERYPVASDSSASVPVAAARCLGSKQNGPGAALFRESLGWLKTLALAAMAAGVVLILLA